jgi:hypothetical protein
MQNRILIELPSSWNSQMIQMPKISSILLSPMPAAVKCYTGEYLGLFEDNLTILR